MIKLIASDIDGTLVKDGDNQLNPEYYQEILRLREKGIQVAVASGRQWHSIERIFDPIKEKVFLYFRQRSLRGLLWEEFISVGN